MIGDALSRREQNKLEKRGRIIAAARALFTRKGFEATTSQEIAEAAGVAAGTVFLYATTKDDLLILVFHDEMLAVVERAYREARSRTGVVDRAVAYFDAMVDYHERDLPLAHALMRKLGYVDNDGQRAMVGDLMTTVLQRLAQLVQTEKASGEVRADAPLMVAARSMFAIYYLQLTALLNGMRDRRQFDDGLRADLELLLRGLGGG